MYDMMEKQDFKNIWLPLSGNFYRVAHAMLGSDQDARDAVQDLYVKLWNIRSSLERIKAPEAYGVRILKNICIDKLRAGGPGSRSEEIGGVPESALCDSVSVPPADRLVISREMLSSLSKAIGTLPENQRTVIDMKFYRQMSYDEIVQRTGISPVNVRVLVSRARKTILSSMREFINGF